MYFGVNYTGAYDGASSSTEQLVRNICLITISQIQSMSNPKRGLVIYGTLVRFVTVVGSEIKFLDRGPTKGRFIIEDGTSHRPIEIVITIANQPTSDECTDEIINQIWVQEDDGTTYTYGLADTIGLSEKSSV